MNFKHCHIIIVGLVYPAFLGAFFYEVAQRFSQLNSLQFMLGVLLILHYVADYVYTADDQRKPLYNTRRMFLDFGLVCLLFFSLRHTLIPSQTDFTIILLYLSIFKGVAFFWEMAEKLIIIEKRRLLQICYL